ncbi:ER membrane complex subunit 3 [Actinomortierella ambigua]|uniref:ER membrane protein complex subunit 3 n=1 Tax=Actinomortierella ambigua TaxID=1343610 RepID=A0A9P6PTJ9_9FUNG|nr:ER membrane complex subunit 3 [Actinomortierella ambigua]KAG0252707.1 ER membrane complex subunit 3 [Actinomortierella ambigua]
MGAWTVLQERQAMLLDPAIRDWVLIPIMFVMVLVGIVRHHVTVLLSGTPKKADLKSARETKALQRAGILRAFGSHLPSQAFETRKVYLCEAFEKGRYLKDPDAKNKPKGNVMQDPAYVETMMDGMKKNMMNIVPQTVIMGWINFFFSGFVLIKLPFPLTIRFKSMLQRGVETSDMDVSWVSSLSWYFLNLFGLQSVFTLILGSGHAADAMRDMQAMSTMGMGAAAGPQYSPTGQPQDMNKVFLSERENLEIAEHEWGLDNVETRLLVKYGKKPREVLLQQQEAKKKRLTSTSSTTKTTTTTTTSSSSSTSNASFQPASVSMARAKKSKRA